jgi:hypothetical protein
MLPLKSKFATDPSRGLPDKHCLDVHKLLNAIGLHFGHSE